MKKMRVLIVEDNRRLAESIRDILKHWYDCDICGDGNTGYFLLTDGGYDAAVLDLMLPGMDGITLLKKARKKRLFRSRADSYCKSEIDDRVLGLESGADYYLTKPFDMQELLAVMKTILRRRGGDPGMPEPGQHIAEPGGLYVKWAGKNIRLGKKDMTSSGSFS